MATLKITEPAHSCSETTHTAVPLSHDSASKVGVAVFSQGRDPRLARAVGWLFRGLVTTTPIVISDACRDLGRSSSSSFVWEVRYRRGKRITIAQARELAMNVHKETERGLREERFREAQFMLDIGYSQL